MLKSCKVLCKVPLGHSDLSLVGVGRIEAAPPIYLEQAKKNGILLSCEDVSL